MNLITDKTITNACIDIIHTNALKLGSSCLIKLDCLFKEEKHYANTSLTCIPTTGADRLLHLDKFEANHVHSPEDKGFYLDHCSFVAFT